MRNRVVRSLVVTCAVGPAALLTPAIARPQSGAADATRNPEAAVEASTRFYTTPQPLQFTLSLNVKQARGDITDDPPARDALLSWRDSAGRPGTLAVKVKTRGRWRLEHCEYPPINLDFSGADTRGTPFEGVLKTRLTSYCRNHDGYEQYVLQEFQMYRAYQVLTPMSHLSRLLRITYVDSASGRAITTRHAFFIEDRDAMAARLKAAWMKVEGALPSDVDPYYSALMGVFEYFIGNTDFLISALHNVQLLATSTGEIAPIAYDFDYAGAVNTVYAVPNPLLKIPTVRQRLFRGYCVPEEEFRTVFALFNEKKAAIYALYDDPIGKAIRWDIANDTKKYFDEFYRVINTPMLAKAEILDKCLKK